MCGLENDPGVVKCGCGFRLMPAGWGKVANFFLTVGGLINYLGCVASILAGLACMGHGYVVAGVLTALLGFCYSAAMVVVFRRVQRMKWD